MKNTSFSPQDFNRIFAEIAETQKWEQLEVFQQDKILELMSIKDRSIIANLFYQKGKHYSLEKSDPASLKEALGAFETALKIDPAIGEAWTEKAIVLVELAFISEDFALFNEANETFTYGQKVYSSQGQTMPVDKIYRWGVCCFQIGKHSEEPLDFKTAVEKFREAFERGYDSSDFFYDYATALAELGASIGRVEFIFESLDYFQRCLKEQSNHAQAWLKLANVCKLLYFITHDPEYFNLADQSFFEAARQTTPTVGLWVNWGQLLAQEGKAIRDTELMAASLEKFEKADALSPNDPLVLSSWAEALMHLGAIEERLDYLREAKEKVTFCKEKMPEDLEIICLYGHCLIHLGRYFVDDRHLFEAVQQFQFGLSKNKNLTMFWHGLATANYLLGEICQDYVYFERAAKYCSEAINLDGGNNAQYWNDWGVALMKLGEVTHDLKHMVGAAEKFEKAIALYNKRKPALPDPEWFYNYGCALDYLGDFYNNPQYYERAIQLFAKILEQNPELNHARYSLALAFYHLGDATAEIEYLERSIEHFDLLTASHHEDDIFFNDFGVTYLTLADILSDSILPKKCEEPFERSEQLFLQAIANGNQIAYYHLACLHSLKGNLEEAMHFIEKAKQCDALPVVEDLLRDEWLEELRQTPRFKTFLSQLSAQFEDLI